MKIKIDDTVKDKNTLIKMLESAGFTISIDSNLKIVEENIDSFIKVLNERLDYILLPINEIISIESLGKDNYVYTIDNKYLVRDTLESLMNRLGNNYIRISKNTIIEKKSIKRIWPSFQMKYKLSLMNGRIVYVTRNYYYSFKEYYGL